MSYLSKVRAIVWKDVRAELRTKDILSSMLVFAGLTVLIFQFAFDLRASVIQLVLPGVLWIAITFAGVLGLNRSFVLEKESGTKEGQLMAPMDRSDLFRQVDRQPVVHLCGRVGVVAADDRVV
ncbi:MAG: heme exporter protein CcmB [Anaerolineae bacterium]|nr:heme exporter protein CcmB [Anaerolineae bacterium]